MVVDWNKNWSWCLLLLTGLAIYYALIINEKFVVVFLASYGIVVIVCYQYYKLGFKGVRDKEWVAILIKCNGKYGSVGYGFHPWFSWTHFVSDDELLSNGWELCGRLTEMLQQLTNQSVVIIIIANQEARLEWLALFLGKFHLQRFLVFEAKMPFTHIPSALYNFGYSTLSWFHPSLSLSYFAAAETHYYG